ncbi:MAG: PAS domain S-box protein, partial [Betaproteobacteria bacterium]
MANDGFTTARKPLIGTLSSLFRRRGVNGGKARNSRAASDHGRDLAAEQIRFLYRQLPPAMFTTTVIGALMVHVLWSNVDRLWLVLWLTAFTAMTAGRLAMMRSYLRANPPPGEAARWGHRFVIGVALSGAIWGAAGIFPFKEPNLIHAMFMAFVLAGLSSGALSTLSSYRWAYIAFLLPALLPFTVRVMLQQGEVFVALSAMLTLFLVMMSIISLRYSASFAQSLRLRFDNLDLLDNLVVARDRQQIVNDALAAEMRERRQTEQALRAGNEVYRTLVDTTGTGYCIIDATGRVLDSNAVYIRLTGHRTLTEILGRSVSEWTAAHDVERTARELEKCRAVGYVRNLEIDYVDAAGKTTPIEINATVVIAVGEPRFLCLTRDIGARKKTERALRHAYDLLERKVTERTAQLAQANQILRTEKERFRVTLASIGDAVITTDAMAQIAYLNAVAEQLTGWTNLECRGRPITEVFCILDETTRERSEDPIRRCLRGNASIVLGTHSVLICRDGSELNVDASVAPIRDNDGATIGTV